ncbi:MAG: serine/threonine protein kinase, partial [Candidatus Acidiferrum sp.]
GLTSDQPFVDRFYREAKSCALLNHPNIVRGIAAGQDEETGKHYMVLEFVDGPSAQALLEAHGPMPVGDAVHLVLDIARGLEHAHSRNVVHRDIKPDNILITGSGLAKLSDLGLAKRTDETSHLTSTRQGFGTTAYMPYEQAMNAKKADGRSDIYALGATFYHLLTGQVPFPGDNHLDVVEKKKIGKYIPAGELNAAVPRVLDQILSRMLAMEPRDRYQTVSDLIVELERSRLAAPVPGYADPELALQDPLVRSRMAARSEPTRPDLDARRPTPVNGSVAKDESANGDDLWVIRFRNKSGQLCKMRRGSTEIIERLRSGRLPADTEARRVSSEEFKPVDFYSEFKGAVHGRPRRSPQPAKRPITSRRRILLIACVVMAAAGLAVLVRLILPH